MVRYKWLCKKFRGRETTYCNGVGSPHSEEVKLGSQTCVNTGKVKDGFTEKFAGKFAVQVLKKCSKCIFGWVKSRLLRKANSLVCNLPKRKANFSHPE